MSSLFSNLTATALLVHALLGCCWHHAHDCQHALMSAECGGLHLDCHNDGDGHACDHQSEPAGEERHGDDGCQTGPCAFVRTQSDSTAWELLVQQRDAPAVAAPVASECREVPGGIESPSSSGVRCPALRPQLLNRVLLI